MSPLKSSLEEAFSDNLTTQTQYHEWRNVKKISKSTGSTTTRITKNCMNSTFQGVIDDLVKDSQTLSSNLHTAWWQRNIYNVKRANPAPVQVICCSDPSENRRNEHQYQPSSAHWGYSQTSICPIILNYKCPKKIVHQLLLM